MSGQLTGQRHRIAANTGTKPNEKKSLRATILVGTLLAGCVGTAALAETSGRSAYSLPAGDDLYMAGARFETVQDRHRDHRSYRESGERAQRLGARDIIRLLEDRGYRVRDIENVGDRYLVRASRRGDRVLVSVSRRGEIMGVVRDRDF
ncbi:hypothetical protein [Agrobacterium sp. NPDC089420]|uniref:hypothetical protein n=1 Tax=Agrobacterium sp. NPDC089420 TaxID=3363918 RepID=UPI00385018BE